MTKKRKKGGGRASERRISPTTASNSGPDNRPASRGILSRLILLVEDAKSQIGKTLLAALGLLILLVIASLSGARSLSDIKTRTTTSVLALSLTPAESGRAAILIANLTGSDGEAQSDLLASILADHYGVQVLRLPGPIQPWGRGSEESRLQSANESAQRWLASKRCDVLIWGQVLNGSLFLRIVPRLGTSIASGAFAPPAELKLPANLRDSLGQKIAIVSALASTDMEGFFATLSADKIRLTADWLGSALRASNLFVGDSRYYLLHAYSIAVAQSGELSGNASELAEAADTLTHLIAHSASSGDPSTYASLLNTLGNIDFARGDLQSDAQLTGLAIEKYKMSLSALPPRANHRIRAITYSNLSVALGFLFLRQRVDSLWQQADDAFRRALEFATESGDTAATTAIRLRRGNLLLTVGRRTQDTVLLSAARSELVAARDRVPRDREPMRWIRANREFAETSMLLAVSSGDSILMHDAVATFERILKFRQVSEYPSERAMAQLALGDSYRWMADRYMRRTYLESAIAAYEQALAHFTMERDSDTWAALKYNIASALSSDANDREGSTEPLRRSIELFHEALRVQRQKHNQHEIAQSLTGVAVAEMKLGIQANDRTLLQSSRTHMVEAIAILGRNEGETHAQTQRDLLAQIDAALQ